jgi:hypothetical protein
MPLVIDASGMMFALLARADQVAGLRQRLATANQWLAGAPRPWLRRRTRG